jgi:glycerophosphoryl diester phosphodiesterase
MPLFDLQGHRGARGLRPENTLPGFEIAFDLGVTTVETDVHLTRDGVPILCHHAVIGERLCRVIRGNSVPEPKNHPPVSTLSLAQIRAYRADRNPDPARFPLQQATSTPLADLFAAHGAFDPFALPTLADLFAFAKNYTADLGKQAEKSEQQRARVQRVRFDIELKRVPFRPQLIGDAFDGNAPALLEQRVVEVIRAADMVERTQVRSFDHRSVRAVRQLEPALTAAVLIAETAPVSPAQLAQQAEAQVYCPHFEFLDAAQVRRAQGEGIRVVPWTVNDEEDWLRLLDWGVDGITTDYPDRLAALLQERAIAW